MNRRDVIKKIASLFVLALLFVPLSSNAAVFTRNLTQGTKGDDVLALQKILNLFPSTRVAVSGPGSPGKETTLFGPATKKALLKFQNLYAKDILVPLGLKQAPGWAGTYTIRKLESFLPAAQSLEDITPLVDGQEANTSLVVDMSPVITSITRAPSNPAPKGTPEKTADGIFLFDNTNTLIITGKNFTKSNTVVFSSDPPITDIVSTDGTTLSVTFTAGMTTEIEKSIGVIPGVAKQIVIDHLIASQKTSSTDPAFDGGWYVPLSIVIQNENGTSNEVPAFANFAVGL